MIYTLWLIYYESEFEDSIHLFEEASHSKFTYAH